MGIFETVPPGDIKVKAVQCLKKRKLLDEVINKNHKVPIKQYVKSLRNTSVKFNPYNILVQ